MEAGIRRSPTHAGAKLAAAPVRSLERTGSRRKSGRAIGIRSIQTRLASATEGLQSVMHDGVEQCQALERCSELHRHSHGRVAFSVMAFSVSDIALIVTFPVSSSP